MIVGIAAKSQWPPGTGTLLSLQRLAHRPETRKPSARRVAPSGMRPARGPNAIALPPRSSAYDRRAAFHVPGQRGVIELE